MLPQDQDSVAFKVKKKKEKTFIVAAAPADNEDDNKQQQPQVVIKRKSKIKKILPSSEVTVSSSSTRKSKIKKILPASNSEVNNHNSSQSVEEDPNQKCHAKKKKKRPSIEALMSTSSSHVRKERIRSRSSEGLIPSGSSHVRKERIRSRSNEGLMPSGSSHIRKEQKTSLIRSNNLEQILAQPKKGDGKKKVLRRSRSSEQLRAVTDHSKLQPSSRTNANAITFTKKKLIRHKSDGKLHVPRAASFHASSFETESSDDDDDDDDDSDDSSECTFENEESESDEEVPLAPVKVALPRVTLSKSTMSKKKKQQQDNNDELAKSIHDELQHQPTSMAELASARHEEQLKQRDEQIVALQKQKTAMTTQHKALETVYKNLEEKLTAEKIASTKLLAEKDLEIQELNATVQRVMEFDGGGGDSHLQGDLILAKTKIQGLESMVEKVQKERNELETKCKILQETNNVLMEKQVNQTDNLAMENEDLKSEMDFKDETIEHLMGQLKDVKKKNKDGSAFTSEHEPQQRPPARRMMIRRGSFGILGGYGGGGGTTTTEASTTDETDQPRRRPPARSRSADGFNLLNMSLHNR